MSSICATGCLKLAAQRHICRRGALSALTPSPPRRPRRPSLVCPLVNRRWSVLPARREDRPAPDDEDGGRTDQPRTTRTAGEQTSDGRTDQRRTTRATGGQTSAGRTDQRREDRPTPDDKGDGRADQRREDRPAPDHWRTDQHRTGLSSRRWSALPSPLSSGVGLSSRRWSVLPALVCPPVVRCWSVLQWSGAGLSSRRVCHLFDVLPSVDPGRLLSSLIVSGGPWSPRVTPGRSGSP